MRKCPYCKTENPEDAKFCKKCGHAFELTCPKCKAINSGDASFCVQCGTSLAPQKRKKTKMILIIVGAILAVIIIGFIIVQTHKHVNNAFKGKNALTVNVVDTIGFPNDSVENILTEETAETEAKEDKEKQTVGTVTDIDGNVYHTVKIGNQVWMKENMKAVHTTEGKSITFTKENLITSDFPCRYYPNNNSSNVLKYGYLYNGPAAREVCPNGWHLPSLKEFQTLIDYCASQFSGGEGKYSNANAKALSAITTWTYEGRKEIGNNKSGFSAMPAGVDGGKYYFNGNIDFGGFGSYTAFWTSSYIYDEDGDKYIACMSLGVGFVCDFDEALNHSKCSVRCIRD